MTLVFLAVNWEWGSSSVGGQSEPVKTPWFLSWKKDL